MNVPRAVHPLTAAQRELAARPENLRLARCIAWQLSRPVPHLFDDLHSAALAGLCDAAAKFDTTRGLKFVTYADHRVRGAVKDAMREMEARGFRRQADEATDVYSLSGGADDGRHRIESLFDVPDDVTGPIGWELESAEELDAGYCKGLPERHRAVIRLLYGHAATATMRAAGRALGVSENQVSRLHARAVEMIGERLGVATGTATAVDDSDREREGT